MNMDDFAKSWPKAYKTQKGEGVLDFEEHGKVVTLSWPW